MVVPIDMGRQVINMDSLLIPPEGKKNYKKQKEKEKGSLLIWKEGDMKGLAGSFGSALNNNQHISISIKADGNL